MPAGLAAPEANEAGARNFYDESSARAEREFVVTNPGCSGRLDFGLRG